MFLPTEVWLQLKLAGSLILVLLDHVYLLKKKKKTQTKFFFLLKREIHVYRAPPCVIPYIV